MILIILHLSFIKFLKYLFTVLMIEREGRGTMKSRMRCERERQMDRKFEIAMEKDARGRKRFFFSLMIFYLPSVSHLCKNRRY